MYDENINNIVSSKPSKRCFTKWSESTRTKDRMIVAAAVMNIENPLIIKYPIDTSMT
jgi:hypothetical protein